MWDNIDTIKQVEMCKNWFLGGDFNANRKPRKGKIEV